MTFESKFADAYPDLYQRLREAPRGNQIHVDFSLGRGRGGSRKEGGGGRGDAYEIGKLLSILNYVVFAWGMY